MMNKLGRQYDLVFRFIYKDLYPWIIGSFIAFIAVTVISYFYLSSNPSITQNILDSFQESTKEIVPGENDAWFRLFQNNLLATASAVMLGFVPFLFLTAVPLISNAAVIGAVLSMFADNPVMIIPVVIFGIMPHGIFELPCVIISLAMGLYLCHTIVRRILDRKREGSFTYAVTNIFRLFICLIVPLLFAAALIEAFLTPVIMEIFI
jgi:stage II sporulation protein M